MAPAIGCERLVDGKNDLQEPAFNRKQYGTAKVVEGRFDGERLP